MPHPSVISPHLAEWCYGTPWKTVCMLGKTLITPFTDLTAVTLRNQLCEVNYTASYFYLPIPCTLLSTRELGLAVLSLVPVFLVSLLP